MCATGQKMLKSVLLQPNRPFPSKLLSLVWPVGAMLGSVLSVPFPGIVLVHTILRVGVLHKHVSLPPFLSIFICDGPFGTTVKSRKIM
jgi:hypothetical protein